MKIELLSKADYKDVMIVWEKSVKATHFFIKEKDFELIKSTLYRILPNMKIFGIKKAGTILGFMGVSDNEIESLFIDPEYFGKGLGKNLIIYAIKDLNLKKVSGNEQNQKAFSFYKKLGFKIVKRDEFDSFSLPYPILHLFYDNRLTSRICQSQSDSLYQ
ncbi:MAG: GNAT family N-acetyltransferase [Endomicrobium sp.]|jgi:putative acetyltransferase|nr:GNAT family N-acetyltransferase [Endomicrobium sp.]